MFMKALMLVQVGADSNLTSSRDKTDIFQTRLFLCVSCD